MNLAGMAQLEYVLLEALCKRSQDESMEISHELAKDFKRGDYSKCALKWSKLLNIDELSSITSFEQFQDIIVQFYSEADLEQRWELVLVGAACLQLFAQINFLGRLEIEGKETKLPAWVEQGLVLDGDSICVVARNIELLLIASTVFNIQKADPVTKSLVYKWWSFRSLWIHQEILDSKSEIIFQRGKSLMESIDMSEETNEAMKVHFNLEVATFNLNYFDIALIKAKVEEAASLAGVQATETGALGKRTKWQQKELAQLTLDIQNVRVLEAENEDLNDDSLPSDLKLDDEVRLDKIAFSGSQSAPDLSLLQSAVILGQFNLHKRSKPRDSLLKEELMPYLDAVLTNKRINFCLKSMALLERSKLEKEEKRGVERALMQIQTLVDSWPLKSNKNLSSRMSLFYACKPPSFWKLEHELVKILISTGSIKTALDYALKLQLWEEVINCYHMLDLRHKAEEVIRQQIEKEGQTALLLCMLGDATDDPVHYEKAIQVSNERSARAFRSLGDYYYARKDYEKTVEYLGKSLTLNSFQPKTLLRHGYSAMELKKWDAAAQSYRSYCVYESDNFEAWNNLANAYINQGQKPRAWKVLQEAVKCDYDNWKVWDNILVVSTDCAHFEEVIRAYHRLLDIKNGKHVDIEVLTILVKAIRENLPDNYERPSRTFKKAALALFGRLTSEDSSQSRIWELYSQLILCPDEDVISEENLFKSAQFMQRATATYMQTEKDWHKSSQKIIEGLQLASKYIESCLKAAEKATSNPTQNIQQMSSAKLTVKSMLSKVKQSQGSYDDLTPDVKATYDEANESFDTLVNAIEKLKSK